MLWAADCQLPWLLLISRSCSMHNEARFKDGVKKLNCALKLSCSLWQRETLSICSLEGQWITPENNLQQLIQDSVTSHPMSQHTFTLTCIQTMTCKLGRFSHFGTLLRSPLVTYFVSNCTQAKNRSHAEASACPHIMASSIYQEIMLF